MTRKRMQTPLSARFWRTTAALLTLGIGMTLTPGLQAQAPEKSKTPLAGKTQAPPPKQEEVLKIPLKLNYLPDPKSTDPQSKARLEVFREFRRLYPYIELSAFSGISIAGIGDESKIMLAIAGGSAPDVMGVNFRMSDTYIQQAFLYPLDEFIERDYPGGMAAFLKDTPAPIRPVIYREGPGIDGNAPGNHIWAIPGELLVRVLMWRKDLFQEVGLDPETPPKNWEELYEFAKKLSDPERNRFGLNMTSGLQAAWDFMAFLWSAGGEAVEKNSDGEWVAVFGSREAAVALDFYVRLATEEWVDSNGKIQRGYTSLSAQNTGGPQGGDAWSEGRLGMMVQYLDSQKMGGGTDASLIGIAPFPEGPTGKRGTELNAGMEGIFSNIQGRINSDGKYVPAEKIREAAWTYINFMKSKEARRITAKVLVDNGLGRMLSPQWLREFGYNEYLKYFPPEYEETFNQAVKDGKPEPYGRNCQMVYLYMTDPIDKAMQLARENKLPDDPEERLDLLQKTLKEASDNTTVQMIGKLSPEERAKRNRVAIIVAIIIGAIFCYALYKIWMIFSPKDSYSGKRKGWEFRKNWLGYLIMIPALVSILIWVYYPMFSGSALLFQDYRVVGGSTWTGFNNLADVLYRKEWWGSVWNTLRYMVLILALGFFAPIILAILLQEVSHAKLLYRTLYYLPAVMSGLVVIYMWRLFYQSGPNGIMNQVVGSILGFFGIDFSPIAWLEDSNWAMLACIIPTVWASAGPGCLIYLAALKGVPDDIYEAAEIDGANFFQKIWHVTLPTLKALIIINFVGAFIGAAQSGGMILIMTFGRANTEVAELHIFKEAYTNLRFGTAIAMAWILGVTTLLFTIYQLKKLSNMEFKTTGK